MIRAGTPIDALRSRFTRFLLALMFPPLPLCVKLRVDIPFWYRQDVPDESLEICAAMPVRLRLTTGQGLHSGSTVGR